jgi:hypothetical protein
MPALHVPPTVNLDVRPTVDLVPDNETRTLEFIKIAVYRAFADVPERVADRPHVAGAPGNAALIVHLRDEPIERMGRLQRALLEAIV